MAKNFPMSGTTSFEVLEDYNLNYETPKTTRVQKKLFASGGGQRKNVKLWNELILCKNSPQFNQWDLQTPPPTMNSPTKQPLAPIKSRKLINKSDLKPKKLIFKEESECDGINFHDNTVISVNKRPKANDDTRSRGQRRKQNPSDDKENHIEYHLLLQNKEIHSSVAHSTKATSSSEILSTQKNLKVKSGFKHLRI